MKKEIFIIVTIFVSFFYASPSSQNDDKRQLRSLGTKKLHLDNNKRLLRSLGTKTLDYEGEIAKFKECEGGTDYTILVFDCFFSMKILNDL